MPEDLPTSHRKKLDMGHNWVARGSTWLSLGLLACTGQTIPQTSLTADNAEVPSTPAVNVGPGFRILARLPHPHEQIVATAGSAALLQTAGGLEQLTYQAGRLHVEPVLSGAPTLSAWDGDRLVVQEPERTAIFARGQSGQWQLEQTLPRAQGGVALHGRWLLLGGNESEVNDAAVGSEPTLSQRSNRVRVYLRGDTGYLLTHTINAPYSPMNPVFGERLWMSEGIAVVAAVERDNPRANGGGNVTCMDAGYVFDVRVSPARELARIPCFIVAVSDRDILANSADSRLRMWKVADGGVTPLVSTRGQVLGSFSDQGFVIGDDSQHTARWLMPTAGGWQATARFVPATEARFHAAVGVVFVTHGDELLALTSAPAE